jgi:hypothetical protein
MEEPKDYTVYCLCSSLSYGLLSGLDRYGIIRYWDRRFSNNIVKVLLTLSLLSLNIQYFLIAKNFRATTQPTQIVLYIV